MRWFDFGVPNVGIIRSFDCVPPHKNWCFYGFLLNQRAEKGERGGCARWWWEWVICVNSLVMMLMKTNWIWPCVLILTFLFSSASRLYWPCEFPITEQERGLDTVLCSWRNQPLIVDQCPNQLIRFGMKKDQKWILMLVLQIEQQVYSSVWVL